MKVLQVVVVTLLLASAFAMNLEAEGKPRRGASSASFSVKPLTWGGAKVVIVSKCDSRAYETTQLHSSKCAGGTPQTAKAAPLDAPNFVPQPPQPIITTASAAAGPARPMLQAATPNQQSAACTGRKGVCKKVSTCTGSVVRGICPGASDWSCCVPKGTAPSTPAPTPGSGTDSCLRSFNGATLAARAIQYQQKYAARGTRYSQSSRVFGYDVPYADCTSFGFSVMQAAGYGCLFDKARYTAGMKPLMAARGGYHQVAKTGDIVMWGGHFGIVVQACAGGKVDMVAMGNSGCRRTGCITVASLKGWGSGGWLGFWTPRAK